MKHPWNSGPEVCVGDLTLSFNLSRFSRSLRRSSVVLGIQDHIFCLESLQLVAEAFAGRFKLDLLQKHFLGRWSQQLIQVTLIAGVLAARLQGLFELVHYRHCVSLNKDRFKNKNLRDCSQKFRFSNMYLISYQFSVLQNKHTVNPEQQIWRIQPTQLMLNANIMKLICQTAQDTIEKQEHVHPLKPIKTPGTRESVSQPQTTELSHALTDNNKHKAAWNVTSKHCVWTESNRWTVRTWKLCCYIIATALLLGKVHTYQIWVWLLLRINRIWYKQTIKIVYIVT